MVSNNVQLSPDTQSEDSELSTPTSGRSPESKNESTASSPPKNTSTKFPGKDLPPPTIDQTPTRFLAGCSKLDLEPNPFEQSFSGVAPISDSVGANSPKPSLPPVSQIASPGLPPSEDRYGWNLQSLRSGALSPSMLAGPQENIMFDNLQPGRTGTTPLPFGSFAESSPGSTALFGVAGNLSTSFFNPALPVTSLSTVNATDQFGRNVFTQGIPRTLTDSERKIATNSVTSISVPTTQPGVIQPGVTATLPSTNLLNLSNGTSVSSSMIGHQNLLVGGSAINNRNMLASTQDTISNALIPDTIMPKTEKDDFVSQTNGNMNIMNNGRQSNGINSGLLAHKASSLSDSMDEDSVSSPQSNKMNTSNSLKSGSRGARRKAEEPLVNEQPSKKNGQKVKSEMTEEEKRKNFLERNRQAALKCRQRKKQWLANLQSKVEFLTNDNENLQNQAQSLREEIINLKTLLLAHKDCPIAQANGVMGLDSIQPSSQGIPQNINNMGIGPNGVPMGMVQSGVSNSNMPSGVQGSMSMANVQVPPHMSNHATGPP
ncbi:13954_t:CDS:2, partial [Acaulospora colombiana]